MFVIYRRFAFFSTVFCALLFLQVQVFADDSVYVIEGVEVDVTADNAVSAREQAFEQAQVEAYKKLLERILTASELENYEIPDGVTISSLVQDFEVTNEQLSAVRYKGTYTFRFRPGAVQGRLATAEVPYVAADQKPVLVLPYQLYGNRSVLWTDDNPFMAAWARSGAEKGALISTILPLGDMLDTAQVQDAQPLNYDKVMLDRMVERYNAEEAVILLAERKPGVGLAVSVYGTETSIPSFMANIQVPERPERTEMQLYDQAVGEVLALLKQDYKVKTEVNPGEVTMVRARARFSHVQEWVMLKKTIESAPGVQSVTVQGLKPREAVVEIEFVGGLNQLSAALNRNGADMRTPTTYGQYTNQLSGAPVYEITLAGHRY